MEHLNITDNFVNTFRFRSNNVSSNADLLGLSTPPSNLNSNQGTLIDVLGDIYSNGNSAVHNAKKCVFELTLKRIEMTKHLTFQIYFQKQWSPLRK